MFATSICKHTRTKEGAPSSREASANYVGPCGQKFQVTYLRSCARFHGLGAVRSPETKQAKTKGGGQMGETESEMDKETGATSSCDNDLGAAAENEWRKEYPSEAHDDWNDRLPNMPQVPIKIVPVSSFLSNCCLNARAHSRYFAMLARELMI